MYSLLHVSVTSNHHQVDISVHGHDMFSAYSMGSHIVYICYVEFQTCTRGADKSLARPTSRYILFDGENISFDASLVLYLYI